MSTPATESSSHASEGGLKQVILLSVILLLSLTTLLFTILFLSFTDVFFQGIALASSVLLSFIGVYLTASRGIQSTSFNILFSTGKNAIKSLLTDSDVDTPSPQLKSEAILKNLPSLVLLYNSVTDTISYANYSVDELFYHPFSTEEKFLTQYLKKSVIRDDFTLLQRHFQTLDQERNQSGDFSFQEIDFRFRYPTGEMRTVRSRDRVFSLAEDGSPETILLVMSDITDFYQSNERTIYNSFILENVGEAIVAMDSSFIIRGWNKTAEKIYETSADDAIGRSLSDALRIQFTATVSAEIVESLFSKGSWVGILEQKKRDGTPFKVQLNLASLRNEDGESIGSVGIIKDITEEIELRSRESSANERFALAVKGSHDGIWDWDIPNNLIYYSERWKSMLGYQGSELQNSFELWHSLLHPEDAPILKETIKKYINREIPTYEIEFRMRHKDGHYRWIFSRASALWDESGKAYRMAGSHTDITERKEAELALSAAKVAAEKASQTKSEFISTITHEIRTPLNGVIGMTSLLSQTTLNFEQRQYLDNIRLSGESLLSLINDILDFSELERNKITLSPLPFSLEETIAGVIELFGTRCAEKGIDISYKIDPLLPPILIGDNVRLRQALKILIDNAVKFTQRGEVHCCATIQSVSGSTLSIQFQVIDTGIGISPSLVNRLFTPFSQLDSSHSRKFGGIGLGLSLLNKLVELLGGSRISVDGQLGQGSRFLFTIPFETPTPISIDTIQSHLSPSFQINKVLLWIDSKAFNRTAFIPSLELYGFKVFAFETIEESRAWMSEDKSISGVVINLPQMALIRDQIHFLTDIRHSFPHIPIIGICFSNHASSIQEIFDFTLLLNKPVKPSRIIQHITELFSENMKMSPSFGSSNESLFAFPPLNILVAEDYSINQRVIQGILKKIGLDADIANNGLEAVSLFKNKDYDIIFMDIQMPEMDGLEATRAILKSVSGEKKPIIIAMTANSTPQDRENCFEVGMSDFLAKPITIESVSAMLAYWSENLYGKVNTDKSPVTLPKDANGLDAAILNVDTLDMLRSLPSESAGSLLDDLIDLFLEQVPSHLDRINVLFSQRDAQLLRKASHALKGTSLNIGALRLSKVAHQIEILAKQDKLDEITSLLPLLSHYFEATASQLKALKTNSV